MRVYGHYVSQPARSVLWLLKINKVPFEFIKVEPMAGGTKKPDYIAKFGTATVPALEDTIDGSSFYLAEMSAIMQYICEKHSLNDWWPTNPHDHDKRAKINEYLSHHHSLVRPITFKLAGPLLKQKFYGKDWNLAEKQAAAADVNKILHKFETVFLQSKNNYINGFKRPTIADLAAYDEISQIEHLGIAQIDGDKLPILRHWLTAMQSVPFHDDVHQSVMKVGKMP